jgi:integrase/recombinase XerD
VLLKIAREAGQSRPPLPATGSPPEENLPTPDPKNEIDTQPTLEMPDDQSPARELARTTPAPTGSLALPGAGGPRPDPVTVFLTGYVSENSRKSMLSSLIVLAEALTGQRVEDPRTVPWSQLRFEHVGALKAKMAGKYASTSVNRHLVALRGVMKTCWRLGLVEREVYDRIADVPMLKASRPDAGRALSEEEVAALFEATSTVQYLALDNVRGAALLAVLLGGGLRRAEVCALQLASFEPKAGSLQVHGKGDKYRTVYLAPKMVKRVEEWVKVRGDSPGPLFCPFNTLSEPSVGRPLSLQGLTDILAALQKKTGIAPFTTHDLRRTFITRLLTKGADPLVVSKLAGHSNVQTTMVYDKRGETAKQQAVTLLDD